METRARLAALRILALREEFSKAELHDALSLAEQVSVALGSKKPTRHAKILDSVQANIRSLSGSESRVVTELRQRDPDRYSILSEIDRSIRLGSMLPRLSDIRRAGCSLDKGFAGGRSKKDAIPRLMAKLAQLSIPELQQTYEIWKHETLGYGDADTEYDDLADFLIRGTRSSASVD